MLRAAHLNLFHASPSLQSEPSRPIYPQKNLTSNHEKHVKGIQRQPTNLFPFPPLTAPYPPPKRFFQLPSILFFPIALARLWNRSNCKANSSWCAHSVSSLLTSEIRQQLNHLFPVVFCWCPPNFSRMLKNVPVVQSWKTKIETERP